MVFKVSPRLTVADEMDTKKFENGFVRLYKFFFLSVNSFDPLYWYNYSDNINMGNITYFVITLENKLRNCSSQSSQCTLQISMICTTLWLYLKFHRSCQFRTNRIEMDLYAKKWLMYAIKIKQPYIYENWSLQSEKTKEYQDTNKNQRNKIETIQRNYNLMTRETVCLLLPNGCSLIKLNGDFLIRKGRARL